MLLVLVWTCSYCW